MEVVETARGVAEMTLEVAETARGVAGMTMEVAETARGVAGMTMEVAETARERGRPTKSPRCSKAGVGRRWQLSALLRRYLAGVIRHCFQWRWQKPREGSRG